MDNTEKEESLQKAQKIVYRLLNFRLRSEQELRNKLIEKKLPTPIVEQTIQSFKNLELVDDRLFAQQWATSRLKKPFGLNRIQLELKKKGVDAAVIQKVLKDAQEGYNELEIVTALAESRAAKYRDITPEKRKQRIYGYLRRRGFTENTIIKVVKKHDWK